MRITDTCGFTIIDSEGVEQPCERPCTGWRWYQGHFHEDTLERACILHENEGGRRMHEAEARLREVDEIRKEWSKLASDAEHYALYRRLGVILDSAGVDA